MSGESTFNNVDDFDKIPDFAAAYKLMVAWGVNPTGVKDKKEAVRRLIEHWLAQKQRNDGDDTVRPNNSDINLRQFFEQDRVRTGLAEKSRNSEKFFEDLPEKLKLSLLKAFPNFLETLRARVNELQSGESCIIVAGEVGAGKSSLINLLLGTDLLPTHQLRCTTTICEIRNSKDGKKEAVAYLKGESDGSKTDDGIRRKKINLDELKGIQELRECLTSANEYDDSLYEKIKIYWPLNLGEGVVLVDTPGVEGGSNVDMSLQQYLSKAFGFIYVINTNAAGGVQHSRLGALLKTVVNAAEDFSPEASLFIGNKWENIPDKDKEAVKTDIYRKLNKVYPGITEEQIHFMSVMKSRESVVNHNQMKKEHKNLLSKIEQLAYDSLLKGIQTHYLWLSSFLNKSLHLIRVANHKDSMSKEELEDECHKLKKQIQQLQKNTDESVNELHRKIDFHIFKITKEITDLLPSRSVIERWTTETCAAPNRKWKIVAEEASCLISKRIQKVVDDWENKKKVLKRIDEEIVDVFAKEFGLMEHQINELEESMYRNRNRNDVMCKTFKVIPVKAIFSKKVKQIEKTYRTLGGAISCVGGLDTSKKNVRQAFKDYGKDPVGAMSAATVLYVETILQHKGLQGKLQKFFSRYFTDIDSFAKRIPGFLQADQQMIETMSQKLKDNLAVSQRYPVLHDSCRDALSRLDTFYVNYIMKFDFQASDIICDYSSKSKIGAGSFADVYIGALRDSRRDVALKIAKDVIKMTNVTDVLTEDKIMRDLAHKYIVRYFGASYKRRPDGIIWIMVMELCKISLKDFYINKQKAKIPGRFEEGTGMRTEAEREMVNNALQICEGLAFIHEKGYTHRDLKMENILFGMDGLIKLTDVGVAKATDLLARTCNGSPAYMAPEVLLSSNNQDNKIDIYSLSFILWEMWYGRDVAVLINDNVLGIGFGGDAMSKFKARQAESDGGFRPPLTLSSNPPKEIAEIMRLSWSTNPHHRPSAEKLAKNFRHFLDERQ